MREKQENGDERVFQYGEREEIAVEGVDKGEIASRLGITNRMSSIDIKTILAPDVTDLALIGDVLFVVTEGAFSYLRRRTP